MRAERKLYKNLRFHLTDFSDAMAFMDSRVGITEDTQQVEAQPKAGSFVEKSSNRSKLLFQRIMEYVASECNMNLSEFQESTAFEDVGADSLILVTIVDRIRRELGFDLDISLFGKHPRVGLLRNHLASERQPGYIRAGRSL